MPRYIDEKEIYTFTDNGKDVFEHYFPNYEFGNNKKFVKEREDEKTASARITYYNNRWRITDFGNQQVVSSMTAIDYVMYKENLTYYEALLWIEAVIIKHTVTGGGFTKPIWSAEYRTRDVEPTDIKGQYNFTYKEVPSKEDLAAIGPFVTAEILAKFKCRCVEKYEFMAYSTKLNKDIVHIFRATKDYPIFVFDYGDFKKIYKPHEMDKKYRFMYVGEKPQDYVYGLDIIKRSNNEFVDSETGQEFAPDEKPSAKVVNLFRCSGESDAMNMASLGFHVYWLNSESAGYGSRYKEIDDMCENHYQILDLDETGKKMAQQIALDHINILTLTLPEWLSQKKDFRGNPCKDIKDFIAQFKSIDRAESEVIMRKSKARKVKFWVKDQDKGTYNFNTEHFFHFLKMNGFHMYKYSNFRNTDYGYVQIKDKIVNIIAPDQVKRVVKKFTRDWIQSKGLLDEIAILHKLNTSSQINESLLDSIDDISLNFNNCTKDEEYLHFKNCSLKITGNSIERVKHTSVPNFILGSLTVKGKELSQIIDFNLGNPPSLPAIDVTASEKYAELLDLLSKAIDEVDIVGINAQVSAMNEALKYNVSINNDKFIFASFIRDITRLHWRKELEERQPLTDDEKREEMLLLANIMFILGYMAAQHKNPSKAWIVFLQDLKESEIGQSSGRSGKSLLTKALTYVRNSFYIGGRELSDQSKYQFIYDGLTEFHDIIEVDDLDEHANFSFFYTQITGNRSVNCKNTSPFVLEYEDSSKMIMSTNFEMPNTDASTLARILNVGVSDYYHEKTRYNDYKETRSPLDKYGRLLFSDFTDAEWTEFYYFMAYCIQLQMRFKKITPPMDNIERRQYRREMSSGLGRGEQFLNWADDYFMVWDRQTMQPEYSTMCNTDNAPVYLNSFFNRKVAYDDFKNNGGLPDSKIRNLTDNMFKKKLIAWCEYKGYTFNPERVLTEKSRRRIRRAVGDKVVELFYISTEERDKEGYAQVDDVSIENKTEEPLRSLVTLGLIDTESKEPF